MCRLNLTPADILAMTARNPAAREAVRRQLAPKATAAQPLTDAGRQAVAIALPWPPSVNGIWKRKRGGGVYLDPVYAAFKKSAAVAAMVADVRPFHGPIDVTLHLHFPETNRKSDSDSRAKAVLDAMNGILWDDDSQIRDLHNVRYDGAEKPRCVVCVTPNVERRRS